MPIIKYVNSGLAGDDGHTGDDPVHQPWKTIQHGVDWFRDHKQPSDTGELNLIGAFQENITMIGVKYSNITIQTDVLGPYNPAILTQYCEARSQIGGDPATGKRRSGTVFTIKDATGVTLHNVTLLLAECGVDAEGAMYLTLDNCCIHDHQASLHGAGFRLRHCAGLDVTQCRVWSNATTLDGGGGWMWSCDQAEITGSLFFLNTASDDGGALYFGRCDEVTVAGCTIGAPLDPKPLHHIGPNRAKNGGGVAINESTGVVFKTGTGPIGSAVVQNAIDSNEAKEFGGGIFMERDVDDCTVQILEKNDIVANRAGDSGGGIAIIGSDNKGNQPELKIQRSQLHRNRALGTDGRGGALYARGAECTLEECQVFRNRAISLGGGIWMLGDFDGTSLGVSSNCDIYENRADNGGGIHASICAVSIRESNIRENVAETYGGGIRFGQFTQFVLNVDKVWFTHNRAIQSGGAIYADAPAVIDGCHFIRNEAKTGAGLLIWETFIDLENSEFKSNVASDAGGACLTEDCNGQLIDSNSFVQNSAGEGGALYIAHSDGKKLPIKNNTFNRNQAIYPAVDAADMLINSINYDKPTPVRDNTFVGPPSVLVL